MRPHRWSWVRRGVPRCGTGVPPVLCTPQKRPLCPARPQEGWMLRRLVPWAVGHSRCPGPRHHRALLRH